MFHRQRFVRSTFFFLCVVIGVVARADGVLDNVPRDAAGFIYLRDPQAFDAKLIPIVQRLGIRNPIIVTPQIIVQATVGKDSGLDMSGEMLLVALPSDRPLDRPPLCVWLPVKDYGQFARALGGKPDEPITVVTIADEDLLCARHGKWALVVDPQQRQRMEAILVGKPDPPAQLTELREWLGKQDMAAAVFPTEATRNALRDWLAAGAPEQVVEETDGDVQFVDDLFGPIERQSGPTSPTPGGDLATFRGVASKFVKDSPQLAKLAFAADAVVMGARLDEAENASAGIRMAWPSGNDAKRLAVFLRSATATRVPWLHKDVDFVASGGGHLPQALVAAGVEAYVARMIDELRRDSRRSQFSEMAITNFRQACEVAANDVLAISAFRPLGAEREGVSTNQFLALRVASANKFVDLAAEVMRRWNELNGQAQPSTGIVFDRQHVQLAGRTATRYSLDIAASIGASNTSEMRQLMEGLFGPERKLQLFVVPADEQTVLLMQGTAQQASAVIETLTSPQASTTWSSPSVAATNRLLPDAADWRLFISPRGYLELEKRESAAAGGTIGGPVQAPISASPPIGLAGGYGEYSLWIDFSLPADTVKAYGQFQNPQ